MTGSGPGRSGPSVRPPPAPCSSLVVGPPVTIEVDYALGVVADHGAIVPGAERVGDRTVRFTADDPIAAYRGFLAINRLAGAVDG